MTQYPYCLCPNEPIMTVVTINKVQNIYKTPVYSLPEVEEQKVLEHLNSCFEKNQRLDIRGYYAKKPFHAVHIGDFQIIGKEEELK